MRERSVILAIALLIGVLILACPASALDQSKTLKVYVNPSIQTGNYSPDGAYQEGSNMQDVAGRLMTKLQNRGFDAKNSGWLDLGPACSDANTWGADCFVALHTDATGAGTWTSTHGTKAFYHQSSGGWHDDNNVRFADIICHKLVDKFATLGRGYDMGTYADYPWCGWNMYVLAPWNQDAIPSTLIEGLYHDNWDDVQLLNTSNGHEAYAQGVFEGICDYYGFPYNGNPPFLFDNNAQGWAASRSTSPMLWTDDWGWPGVMYTDQTGDDPYIYSSPTNFTALEFPQCINVNVYPQDGTTANHDMQLFWKSTQSSTWDDTKSTAIVNYTAQNAWTTVNLDLDKASWYNQQIRGLRLDYDQVNSSTRWIVNHIVLQDQMWWHFNSDAMGWSTPRNMSAIKWTGSNGWPGCIYSDQTADDAYMYGPPFPVDSRHPYHYIGGVNDKIRIRVYPQNGTSANHDMKIYFITVNDQTWNEAKSCGPINFTAQNQWVDLDFPVGQNPAWGANAGQVTQIRVDFDQINHGTRWIIDYIRSRY